MSDNEEALDDFPTEYPVTTAESMVGACRAGSADQWTAASGITTKIPPLFDGSTSWFKYEGLIDDWLDLTVLEVSKRGPANKEHTCPSCTKVFKGLLNRESLTADDGVKYFRDTLRPHFIKGAHSVFLFRSCQFIQARRENIKIIKYINKFSLLLKRLKDAWMDMLPLSAMSQEETVSILLT